MTSTPTFITFFQLNLFLRSFSFSFYLLGHFLTCGIVRLLQYWLSYCVLIKPVVTCCNCNFLSVQQPDEWIIYQFPHPTCSELKYSPIFCLFCNVSKATPAVGVTLWTSITGYRPIRRIIFRSPHFGWTIALFTTISIRPSEWILAVYLLQLVVAISDCTCISAIAIHLWDKTETRARGIKTTQRIWKIREDLYGILTCSYLDKDQNRSAPLCLLFSLHKSKSWAPDRVNNIQLASRFKSSAHMYDPNMIKGPLQYRTSFSRMFHLKYGLISQSPCLFI